MDLDTLVSVCGGSTNDRKITCETLAVDTDLPPESFWLSKDAEFDWFDRNAFLERQESTKGNTTTNHSNSNSQRFVSGLKSKATILGLPKTNIVVDSKRRQCRAANVKLFPKRPDSVGKTTTVAEPSSPKVSCMGRVRSKKGKKIPAGPELRTSRSLKMKKPELRTSLSMKKKNKTTKKLVSDRTGDESLKKAGILSRLTKMFGSDGQRRKSSKRSGRKINEPVEEHSRRSETVNKGREYSAGSEVAAEPPSIGAMTRFVSGRRSDAFGAGDTDVARRESFDLGRRGV